MEKDSFWPMMGVLVTGLIGVASLALIISKNSNTTGVITSSFSGFSNALATALSPVTSSGSMFPIQ
jgi:FtsH-binding integral membrane protein